MKGYLGKQNNIFHTGFGLFLIDVIILARHDPSIYFPSDIV